MVTFKLLGFPVQVHLSFALILLFVFDSGLPVQAIILWAGAVFLSVLIHELGHAVTARATGAEVGGITIYALGGLTTWRAAGTRIGAFQRFIISAAGSGVEIVAGLVLYQLAGTGAFGEVTKSIVRTPFDIPFWSAGYAGQFGPFLIGAFIWVSVFWGLVNWLPIGGLDGSHMLSEIMVKINPRNGAMHTKVIGLIVAAGAGYILYERGFTLAPLIFLWFAMSDLMGLLNARR